ncbi:MAG: hypothetical protein AAGJ68_10605 [Pseudomonadota bacterium]
MRVEFPETFLCVAGLSSDSVAAINSAQPQQRILQWSERQISQVSKKLTESWPEGVTAIRVSQGRLRMPQSALRPADIPDALAEVVGPTTYYWHQRLHFGGEDVVIRCSPSFITAAAEKYGEVCSIFANLANDLRVTIYVLTGVFYDGGNAWPTLMRDYDEAAWQSSLDHTVNFLNLTILSTKEN